jgi:RimJ/RimL family protein N-acetyltransferase
VVPPLGRGRVAASRAGRNFAAPLGRHPYDGPVERAKTYLRAVLPPVVVSAARRVRRRARFLRMAQSPQGPLLSDGVVELRLIDKHDLDMVKRAAGDFEIRRRFGLLKAKPCEYLARYRELSHTGGGAAFAICDYAGGECFGLLTFELRDAGRAELGYWLLPEGRGRGRATRALRLLSRWALSQAGVARLELSTSPENAASQRVAERSGFRREGVLRSYHVVDDRREDAVLFSLLPGELDEQAEDASASALSARIVSALSVEVITELSLVLHMAA